MAIQYNIPFVVSAVFFDGKESNHIVQAIEAGNETTAVGLVVSQYYMAGGKLPLMVVYAIPIELDTLEGALKIYKRKAEAEEAEKAKVTPFSVIAHEEERQEAE